MPLEKYDDFLELFAKKSLIQPIKSNFPKSDNMQCVKNLTLM